VKVSSVDGHRGGFARRGIGALLWGWAMGQVIDAALLRRRRNQVGGLPDGVPGDHPGRDEAAVLSIVGSTGLDDRTLAATIEVMEASGARVVDLVPGDLPAERALRLLRRVDPQRLHTDPMAAPGGAHEHVVLHPSVARRMEGGRSAQLDRAEMVRRTRSAQRHAPTLADLRVAPRLRTTDLTPADRWRELEELTAFAHPFFALAPGAVALRGAQLVGLTAGVLVSPPAGLAVLAAWSLAPLLVFAGRRPGPGRDDGIGGPLHPPGLVTASVGRLPRAWVDLVRTVRAGRRRGRAEAARRSRRPLAATPSSEELMQPRRDDCAWCGARGLAAVLDTTDLVQHRPGTFHLDRCTACGHVFQNPVLTEKGLDHYYDEFYEGIGQEGWEFGFARMTAAYQGRLETVLRRTRPEAWLDVGAGHGHFCLHARQAMPGTRFDGLDISSPVEEAQRRGWVDTAYRGIFPDLVDTLPRIYDVVSMHHYLEHTLDPRRELAAAAKLLRPGGHLMIEVPDPESPWARRLGRFWSNWGQPQHLHLLPCANLVAALEGEGFDVVSTERGAANLGGDLTLATTLFVQSHSRSPHMPWHPAPSRAQRVWRLALAAAAVPVVGLAVLGDAVKDARIGPDQIGNAYRVVAVRRR
jgi:SAM-dependent methyltransferase